MTYAAKANSTRRPLADIMAEPPHIVAGLTPHGATPGAPSGHATITPQIITTDAGITAWLVEDHSVPLISLYFAMPGGSIIDPAGKAGLGLLTRTLLDEGAGDLDTEAFHKALEDHAIELSFSFDTEHLRGSLRTMARHEERAFALLALALGAPRFDEAPLQRMKGEIEAALKREETDPDTIAAKNWNMIAFVGHPLALPRNGTLETIGALTRDDVVAHAGKLLVRENLKLAVVGAITADALRGRLDALFAALPMQAKERSALVPTTMQGLGETKIFDLDLPQTAMRFGRPGIMREDPDFIAASVLAHILGGGAFTSRLWQEIREKRGLAYSIYMRLSYGAYAATLEGMTYTKNERVYESLSLIHEQMALLNKVRPSADELAKAKDYLIGSYPLRFDTSMHIAAELVQMQIEKQAPDWLTTRNGLLAKVTMDDIERVTPRLLGDERLLVTMAGRPVKA